MAAGSAVFPAPGEELRRIEPPDPKPSDPALAQFLDRLQGIVVARNYVALEKLMRPEFRVEFDAGHGPAAFRSHWRRGKAR